MTDTLRELSPQATDCLERIIRAMSENHVFELKIGDIHIVMPARQFVRSAPPPLGPNEGPLRVGPTPESFDDQMARLHRENIKTAGELIHRDLSGESHDSAPFSYESAEERTSREIAEANSLLFASSEG